MASSSANREGRGSSLQEYNAELVSCIDDLRDRREELNRDLLHEEEHRAQVQQDLATLMNRLATINESLSQKIHARNQYDRTIQETEGAFMKILENSESLLQTLKKETKELVQRKKKL